MTTPRQKRQFIADVFTTFIQASVPHDYQPEIEFSFLAMSGEKHPDVRAIVRRRADTYIRVCIDLWLEHMLDGDVPVYRLLYCYFELHGRTDTPMTTLHGLEHLPSYIDSVMTHFGVGDHHE
ncbi:MAG: hypothetical protein AAF125_09910 [Chloroflexota bacterium]